MPPRPVTPGRLPDLIAELIAATRPECWLRVAIDGAPAAGSGDLADRLVDPLRVRGRQAVRVRAGDYLRPASVRLEHGHTDPESYRSGWLDAAGLRREVLVPFAASGAYLPALWDAAADRAARQPPGQASPGAVLLVDGALLLDKGLPFDFAVHLRLSAEALARRTHPDLFWTLPAYDGYHGRIAGDPPDVVVHADDPRHPAVVAAGRALK